MFASPFAFAASRANVSFAFNLSLEKRMFACRHNYRAGEQAGHIKYPRTCPYPLGELALDFPV
jgi:hypothetical protein